MIFNVVKQPVRAKYADDFPLLIADYIAASRAEPGNLFERMIGTDRGVFDAIAGMRPRLADGGEGEEEFHLGHAMHRHAAFLRAG